MVLLNKSSQKDAQALFDVIIEGSVDKIYEAYVSGSFQTDLYTYTNQPDETIDLLYDLLNDHFKAQQEQSDEYRSKLFRIFLCRETIYVSWGTFDPDTKERFFKDNNNERFEVWLERQANSLTKCASRQ